MMAPPARTVIARWLAGGACALALAVPASAQLRAEVFASGFSFPVAFAEDPARPNIHVVAQQNGIVYAMLDGVVVGTFLDLSSVTIGGGESGLLGFAFAPDYATSRRFYVNFTNLNDDNVIARFEHLPGNPLQADPASRFDLVWPDGLSYLDQAFTNHNGGHLAFGPDGYLYIGTGDGGGGNDPFHLAQNPLSLLGKMLRIDVSVPDNDPQGYDVPATNPFVGVPGVLPEIWAFGLRNPWRYSFDDPARGGTGALVIGDVGQGKWEEVDYEPAGAGGRNYGWRLREGAHDNVLSLPPFSLPLTEPIFEYDHNTGHSITGGVVYRGSALGSAYRGRYFFGDFSDSRVWSAGLSINPVTGEATVTDVIEHSAELGAAVFFPSTFATGSDGEIFLVSYAGVVYRIAAGLVTNGNFSSGMSGWTTFATPDPSYLVGGLNGGVFEFYRQQPPPGTQNQAVIFQSTFVPLFAGATIAARFDLGNSSNARKRVSVILGDYDFSDLFVCTFWLEPGAPLRTYEMYTHTNELWDNPTIRFYAATAGSQGGSYRLDNVSLHWVPNGLAARTACVDPFAPAPPGGPSSQTLLINGAFSGGLGPWVLFGQIAAQLVSGVLEFRQGVGTPAGAVLQPTTQPIASRQLLMATFLLGNSSAIRQRVTVLLHDLDFSDMSACTFWLAPGAPLARYNMHTYTTKAWDNATVSFYPANPGSAPWLQLDDVAFHLTPSLATNGTDCIEPGGAGAAALAADRPYATRAMSPVRSPLAPAARRWDPRSTPEHRVPVALPANRGAEERWRRRTPFRP